MLRLNFIQNRIHSKHFNKAFFQDTSIALKAMTLYSRLLQEHIGHQSINVDVDLTASDKNKTSVKVVHPLFAGSVFFDVSDNYNNIVKLK